MDSGDTPTTNTSALRHYGIVMAFAIVGLILVFWGVLSPYYTELIRSNISEEMSSTTSSVSLPRAAPVRIQIPSIHLDTTFVPPLTLNTDKTVSVPDNYTEVGWYSGGASPGEVGPAVILGHVDSVSGPAVFYSLGQVKVGDVVTVTRTDGTDATFEITELQRYPQSEFPTEAVYGKTDIPTLRLVTCTGTFDYGKQRYSHNLVVYGKLIN